MSPEHVLLGVVDEDVEAALESRVPEALVDEVRPLGLDAALVAVDVALEGEVLELLVRRDQGDRGGRLVDLAALDADQPVLDDVDAADAVLAGEHVELLDGLQRRHRDAVDRRRDALGEGDQ